VLSEGRVTKLPSAMASSYEGCRFWLDLSYIYLHLRYLQDASGCATGELILLDLTEALWPSELFALRWRSFDNKETLTITETVYKGKIRPYGTTEGSLTDVHPKEETTASSSRQSIKSLTELVSWPEVWLAQCLCESNESLPYSELVESAKAEEQRIRIRKSQSASIDGKNLNTLGRRQLFRLS